MALLASLGKLGLSEHMLLWSLVEICGDKGAGADVRSHKEPHNAPGLTELAPKQSKLAPHRYTVNNSSTALTCF